MFSLFLLLFVDRTAFLPNSFQSIAGKGGGGHFLLMEIFKMWVIKTRNAQGSRIFFSFFFFFLPLKLKPDYGRRKKSPFSLMNAPPIIPSPSLMALQLRNNLFCGFPEPNMERYFNNLILNDKSGRNQDQNRTTNKISRFFHPSFCVPLRDILIRFFSFFFVEAYNPFISKGFKNCY